MSFAAEFSLGLCSAQMIRFGYIDDFKDAFFLDLSDVKVPSGTSQAHYGDWNRIRHWKAFEQTVSDLCLQVSSLLAEQCFSIGNRKKIFGFREMPGFSIIGGGQDHPVDKPLCRRSFKKFAIHVTC